MPMQFAVNPQLLMRNVNTLEKTYSPIIRPEHDDTYSEELGYVEGDVRGLTLRFSLAELIIHAAKLGSRIAQKGEVK